MRLRFPLTVAGLLAALALTLSAVVATPASNAATRVAAGNVRTAVAAPAAATTKISTTHGALGTYLVGPNGHTVYLWNADSKNLSACSGACAKVWPPVMVTGKLVAGPGVKSSLLGSIPRKTGGKQVTYAGHPLYYYETDKKAGQTTGQGSLSFGDPWYVLSTAGKAIKKS